MKYTGDCPFKDIDEAKSFIIDYIITNYSKPGLGRLSCFIKETHTYIGWSGLKLHSDSNEVDLGFRIMKEFWNNGYATESSNIIIDHAFNTLNLPYIIGNFHYNNIASQRVLEKCNFKPNKTNYENNEKWYSYILQNSTTNQ